MTKPTTLRPSRGSYLMKIERIPQRYMTKKGGVQRLKTFITVYGRIFSGVGCYLKAIGYANSRVKFGPMTKARKSNAVTSTKQEPTAQLPSIHMLSKPKGNAEIDKVLADKRAKLEKLNAEANKRISAIQNQQAIGSRIEEEGKRIEDRVTTPEEKAAAVAIQEIGKKISTISSPKGNSELEKMLADKRAKLEKLNAEANKLENQ